MSEERWTAVDSYVADLLAPHDAALDSALRASVEAGLPAIQVSPAQGKFLHLLARIQRSRAILEIGTLGGYSTIWLARGGLAQVVELRLGKALETLPQLAAEKCL